MAAEAMSSPRREPSPDRAQAKETATRPVVLESYKVTLQATQHRESQARELLLCVAQHLMLVMLMSVYICGRGTE